MIRSMILAAVAAALASCGAPEGEDAAVGGLTAGESAQLEKAAERLDSLPPSPALSQSQALEAQSRTELEAQRRTLETR